MTGGPRRTRRKRVSGLSRSPRIETVFRASAVARLEKIVELVVEPPTISAFAIPVHRLFTAQPSDTIGTIAKTMAERTYTHTPICHGTKVAGVFSESTLLSWAAAGLSPLDPPLPVSELGPFINFDRQSEIFRFCRSTASLRDVADLFREGFERRERLAMVFLTKDGKPKSDLEGLLTIWDLVGSDRLRIV
jgi:CBS domain-containing protein